MSKSEKFKKRSEKFEKIKHLIYLEKFKYIFRELIVVRV